MDQLAEEYPFIKNGLVEELSTKDAIDAIRLIQHDPDKLSELNQRLQGLVDIMYKGQTLPRNTEYSEYPNILKTLAILHFNHVGGAYKRKERNSIKDFNVLEIITGIVVALVVIMGGAFLFKAAYNKWIKTHIFTPEIEKQIMEEINKINEYDNSHGSNEKDNYLNNFNNSSGHNISDKFISFTLKDIERRLNFLLDDRAHLYAPELRNEIFNYLIKDFDKVLITYIIEHQTTLNFEDLNYILNTESSIRLETMFICYGIIRDNDISDIVLGDSQVIDQKTQKLIREKVSEKLRYLFKHEVNFFHREKINKEFITQALDEGKNALNKKDNVMIPNLQGL